MTDNKQDNLLWSVMNGETRVEVAPQTGEAVVSLRVRTPHPNIEGMVLVRGVALNRKQTLGLAQILIQQVIRSDGE